jgi:hypothetical protein
MVRNGSNVQLVTESEGVVSCVRFTHYVLLISLLRAGRVRDRRYIINMFLATKLLVRSFHTRGWRIKEMKYAEEMVVSSVSRRTTGTCPTG